MQLSFTDLCEGGDRGLSSGGGSSWCLMEGSSWGGRARGCRRGGRGHTGGWLLLLLEGILVALGAEPISVGGPKEAAPSAAQDGPGLQLVALSLHPPVDLRKTNDSACLLLGGVLPLPVKIFLNKYFHTIYLNKLNSD